MNEEALVKLGSEKLARLVIDEAKRHASFWKLVAAAFAAKGPAAVAAIIDKRLAGVDRAGIVDWEKAKGFNADIAATLAAITGKLAYRIAVSATMLMMSCPRRTCVDKNFRSESEAVHRRR